MSGQQQTSTDTSTNSPQVDIDPEDVDLPIKRTEGETLKERMTANAYDNILPARYLRKNTEGEVVEDQEDVFKRVGRNIALAELVYIDAEISVQPKHLKQDHHKRAELCEEVFGEGVSLDDTTELTLTEDNVYAFDFDAVLEDLPAEIAEGVEDIANKYVDLMEDLSFIPNTPTIINAGDDFQQLSACFVLSPEDDISDIHEKAKESAEIFQSGGGTGYAFHKLRPYGDTVTSTGGISSGPLSFMNTFDQVCSTIAQGGVRRGAQMGIMKIDHPDVPYFIHAKNKDVSLAKQLKLNDPDDFTHNSFSEALEEARELIDDDGRVPEHLRNAVEGHLSNFNISVGVTDDFMEAVFNDDTYELTNPRTEEPHIATEETEEMYGWFDLDEYVEVGEPLELPAREVWDRVIDGAHENGEPGVIFLERANKMHSFDVEDYPDKRINATNPCVTGDTRISTNDGLKTAEELYNSGESQEVIVDSRFEEDTVQEASSVYKTGTKEVYTLHTSEGYELRLTADHRVKTEDGWKEAQNLSEGDTVLIQDTEGGFGSDGTEELGQILGWLVGDGQIKHSEERATLHFYDEDCDFVAEQMESSVNDTIRPSNSNNPQNSSVGLMSIQETSPARSTGEHQRLRSTRLYEIAEEYDLVDEKLQVPDDILSGSKEMASGFLNALFSADGGVYGDPEKGSSVRLHSVSQDLLQQVQNLLLNFGIYSRIYTDRKEAGMRELPDGQGGVKEYETQAYHDLVISKKSLQTFQEEIGFYHDDKAYKLDEILRSYDRGPYGNSFTATVDSVESDGVESVFDLTEPTTNSFVANGIVVHNCGEQPLIEYEACNLGHINLSTLVSKDVEHWKTFEGAVPQNGLEDGTYTDDELEEVVSTFLEQALDWDALDHRIEYGTRFLDNVVTMSDFPVEEIGETVKNHRKIGLGIMGLAQMYVQIGTRYGSDVSNEIARQVMQYINHQSKQVSQELAEQRGSFNEWDKSKFADPTAYPDWFEKLTGEDPADWEDGFPVRNHNTTTIAPTGTTSMLGNTTGGCEPMYNIAFYKNVSDDVQGDEMLVEFDDYFLRVLEENDIPVEPVKEEAESLMANNEFSADALTTVPSAITDLFVTTGELSAKEHAAIQCALQEGVDSSISKTVNAPNEDGKESAREVFEFIYKNGGKGVTYYRDGTRSKQVLTTRAQNSEFSSEDVNADELLEVVEDHTEDEWFRQELAELLLDAAQEESGEELTVDEFVNELGMGVVGTDTNIQPTPRSREKALYGRTEKVKTGYGSMYVTINEDDEGLVEVFAQIGKSGGFMNSFTESIARLVSMALRSGIPAGDIIESLEDIRSPKIAWDDGDKVQSIPDGIATAIERYLNSEERVLVMAMQGVQVDTPDENGFSPEQVNQLSSVVDSLLDEESLDGIIGGVDTQERLDEEQYEEVSVEETVEKETQDDPEEELKITDGSDLDEQSRNGTESSVGDMSGDPMCPECQSMDLYYSEGCKTCENCGWSEC